MSRKDIIKKSLAITEYPWSSDDELEAAVPQTSTTRFATRSQPTAPDIPGSSGIPPPVSQPQQSQPAPRRNQDRADRDRADRDRADRDRADRDRVDRDRADRDLFWSHVDSRRPLPQTNRQRLSDGPTFHISRVIHTPAAELNEGAGMTNMQRVHRILAFKRFERNIRWSLRNGRPVDGLIPVSRVNPGVVVPSEATSTIRIRAVPDRRYYRSTPSSGSSRTGGVSSPHRSRARHEHDTTTPRETVQVLDDDETEPSPTILRQNISDENPEQEESFEGEGEGPVLETSGDTAPLEESMELTAEAGDDVDAPVPDQSHEEIQPPLGYDNSYQTTNADPNLSSVSQPPEAELPLPPPSTSHGVKRSRRESNATPDPFTVKEFNQNLLRLLECPVCLEWMEPPMSQCRRGHLVCGRCRARLNCCPVCRTAFSSVRNRAMEGVAEMLRYPCRHGCGREVRLRRRTPHEASCAARRYLCPAPLCAETNPLPRAALHQHFQSPKQKPGVEQAEDLPSKSNGRDDEAILIAPESRKDDGSILQRLLQGTHDMSKYSWPRVIHNRSIAYLESCRLFVRGLPGGRPPPEQEGEERRRLERPYLEALQRLAAQIAEEQNMEHLAQNQENAPQNPEDPPFLPPVQPNFVMPPIDDELRPLNAGPHFFLGLPHLPLPLGVRHNEPFPAVNMFPPNEIQPEENAQQLYEGHYHPNGAPTNGELSNGANDDESKHLPVIKMGRRHKFSMKVNLEQHDNWLIFAMDEYFHLRIDVDIRTWGVIVYVSFIGPKCDAKNYTYGVTVDGQHNSRKISYCRATHSDLESSSLNVTRQDCFHLTLDQALNFIRFKNRHCDSDKFLDFNVEISKLEPTSRDESDS